MYIHQMDLLKKILYPYQLDHTKKLAKILRSTHICFDSSETGVGKTYTAIAVAKILNMKIFVICPKTIMSQWMNIIGIINVDCIGIANHELIIRNTFYEGNKKKKCKYVKKTKDNFSYEWDIPENTMIIFDEVHKCSNPHSQIGRVLLALKSIYSEKNPLLLISATICDGPKKFKLYGDLLKWYNGYNSAPHWLDPEYNPVVASKMIHDKLKNNLCKIMISDLGNSFQKNSVTADYYDIKNTNAKEIDLLHDEVAKSLKKLNDASLDDKKNGFTIGIRNRQKIELLKIQIFIDLTEEYLDNNFSVIIFVNYTETIKILAQKLKTNCIIYGEQSLKERLKNIDDFTNDLERIIICNIQCGGDSISLNDKNGKYKRVSLLSPPFSAIKLIQACGRNSRIDSKTQSLNKIIYANTAYEKMLCNKIKDKCSMYSEITNIDLTYDRDEF